MEVMVFDHLPLQQPVQYGNQMYILHKELGNQGEVLSSCSQNQLVEAKCFFIPQLDEQLESQTSSSAPTNSESYNQIFTKQLLIRKKIIKMI